MARLLLRPAFPVPASKLRADNLANDQTLPATRTPSEATDATEEIRRRDTQIDRLVDVLDRQSRMIDALLAQAQTAPRPVPAPPVAPPPAAVLPAASTMTFADLWVRYFASMQSKSWSAALRAQVERVLQHFAPSVAGRPRQSGRHRAVTFYGPDLLVSSVRSFHWTDFRDQIIREGKIGVTFRNLMLMRVMAMFNWSVRDGRLKANPLKNVQKEPRRPKRQTEYSEEEIERVLADTDERDPEFAAYFVGLNDSGMRPGEMRKLKRTDVDFETGRVQLWWVGTKTKRSRVTWITPRVIEPLRRLPAVAGSPYLFPSPYKRGRPVSASRFEVAMVDVRERLGISAAPGDGKVRAADSRRTFASRLSRENVPITQISALLGHSSLETTNGYYLTTREQDLHAAHAKIHDAIRRPPHRAPTKTRSEE